MTPGIPLKSTRPQRRCQTCPHLGFLIATSLIIVILPLPKAKSDQKKNRIGNWQFFIRVFVIRAVTNIEYTSFSCCSSLYQYTKPNFVDHQFDSKDLASRLATLVPGAVIGTSEDGRARPDAEVIFDVSFFRYWPLIDSDIDLLLWITIRTEPCLEWAC